MPRLEGFVTHHGRTMGVTGREVDQPRSEPSRIGPSEESPGCVHELTSGISAPAANSPRSCRSVDASTDRSPAFEA